MALEKAPANSKLKEVGHFRDCGNFFFQLTCFLKQCKKANNAFFLQTILHLPEKKLFQFSPLSTNYNKNFHNLFITFCGAESGKKNFSFTDVDNKLLMRDLDNR